MSKNSHCTERKEKEEEEEKKRHFASGFTVCVKLHMLAVKSSHIKETFRNSYTFLCQMT